MLLLPLVLLPLLLQLPAGLLLLLLLLPLLELLLLQPLLLQLLLLHVMLLPPPDLQLMWSGDRQPLQLAWWGCPPPARQTPDQAGRPHGPRLLRPLPRRLGVRHPSCGQPSHGGRMHLAKVLRPLPYRPGGLLSPECRDQCRMMLQ